MASRNFYLNIVVRILLLAAVALFAGWIISGDRAAFGVIFLLLIFMIQVIELINYLNRTNVKIAFFFDAIKNDDSTLNFPEKTGNRTLNELNASLNRVNEHIKTIKFELEQQEQYFQTILEHISIGVVTTNEKGTIFLSNSAARQLLSIEHLNHISQLRRIDEKLFAAFRDLKPPDNRLISFNTTDGPVQLSLKSTKFKTASETLHLVTIQDIKNELETKELESWIKLIRVLTHEIMNTIAPITSLSQTILGYFKNSEDQVPTEKMIGNTIKGLEVINERGNGLIAFVDTYRKLTRIPPPEKKLIPLKPFLENIITLLGMESIDEHFHIKLDVTPDDLDLLVDSKQLSQVLINLIKNSAEALKNNEDGRLTISGHINKNGRKQISVSDNGPGIPDVLMDKIFIPFFTTKEQGTGIGLSLSRQIMLLHGGSIRVLSKPGEYTEFILEF